MTPSHSTQAKTPRTDPFRWSRADVANALDHFTSADSSSQRHCAEQLGIPHATLNYWTRHYSPDQDDPVDSFFRSPCGEAVLRRIVLAALTSFHLHGACGIRLVAAFLEQAQLDRFVATSRGALHPFAATVATELVAFRDCEQPTLAQQMKPRTITLVPDEHFHSGQPCLVAIEPVSNFVLVECYKQQRDADTWKEAVKEGMAGMPVEVVQMTSDEARALICLAEKGFDAAHSPDLFHGQRHLLQPLLLPLTRPIQQAEKELEKASKLVEKLDGPAEQAQTTQQLNALIDAVRQQVGVEQRLEQAKARQEKAVQEVRAVADDYHPFDRQTGQPLSAEEVGKRLNRHIDEMEKVVEQAKLGDKPRQAVARARPWLATLMGCVAWFWSVATARVEEMDLDEEQERVVKEKLLAGHYWTMAAGRARTVQERKRLKELAERLKREAWQEGGALSRLSEQEKKRVAEVAQQGAELFQRSSSCVEGRNGRLSLQHHGHSRVSEQRLKALTVLHNYLVKRADGTTAAERFYGQKHKDLFSWLLERMPDLPRPAQKRPKPPAETFPVGCGSV